MNILMISGDHALASGRRGAFYNTLQELHKYFERIDVICPRVPVRRYDMSVFGNVFIHPSPWPSLLQPFWILYKGWQIFRKVPFTAFTCHEYPPFYNGIGARLLHSVIKIPYMLEIHHITGFPRAANMKEHFYRWLTGICIAWDAKGARVLRVVNHDETPNFLSQYRVPARKIAVVPAIYLDLKTFTPQDIQKQYDLIFVGRLAKNKGLDLFLKIVEYTKRTAIMIGDGPLLQSAKQWVRKHDCRVYFHGFAKDAAEIAHLMNRSRLLLMTSFNEGGPRVVPEALACGVPVVATPVGIVPDILPPECIEGWNVKDFSAKVMNLLSDPVLYARVREQGLFAVQKFEKGQAIATYAETLKKLTT